MKKAILTFVGVFLFSGIALSQVIADFEKDISGFADQNWGTAITGAAQIADPTGKSAGVAELSMNFGATSDKDAFAFGDAYTIPSGTHFITYWVNIPTGIPDGIGIGVYAQDTKNWAWNENITDTKDIPKDTWFPLSFNLEAAYLKNSSFDIVNGKLKTGLQIQNYSQSPVVPWTGKILVDNVTLIGVEPKGIADFEKDLNGFVDKNWATAITAVTQIADPTGKSKGAAELSMNFGATSDKDAFGVGDALTVLPEANFITYWVNIPTGIPDGIGIGVFAQDTKNWAWNETTYDTKDIPKDTWFPLSFDLRSAYVKNANFDIVNGKLQTGLQIQNYSQNPVVPWTGKILVDNVAWLSKETGVKWIIASFNNEAAGVQGFTVPSWAPALTSVQWAANAERGGGVLQGNIDYSKGAKVAFQKDDIKLYDADNLKYIDEVTIDIFIPSDIPAGGTVDLVYQQKGGSWAWLAASYPISDTGEVAPGKWRTMHWNVAANRSQLDSSFAGIVFVELKCTSPDWKGTVLLDNLTLVGIAEPAGTNLPVAMTAVADTTKLNQTGKIIDWIHLNWTDNTIKTETYNLYVSEKPITDVSADGVVKFAPGIPHGLQSYAQRPYSSDGSVKNLYYAVTSVADGIETAIEDKSKAGPIAVKTTPTFKVKYVKDFASKFSLDGLDNEFTDYKTGLIIPESAGSPRATSSWTPESADLSFKITLVVDDKYLYISADINDDEVINNNTYQAWQGDAIEFFMGFYDARTLKEWHGKNFQHANGDWRFAFTSRGTTALDGGTDAAIPGCEATTYVKFSGDGYICEARIVLDSLAKGNKFGAVTNGMLFPFRIDCNDVDLLKGDTGRGLQCGIGGVPTGGRVDLNEDWTRPHGWGFMEVIDGPTAVENAEEMLPKEFALHNNYPNPFNPATMIKYDLPKETDVTLKVYDMLGKEVVTLINEKQSAGYHQYSFNASHLASGVYFYRINAGTFVQTKKMVLVK